MSDKLFKLYLEYRPEVQPMDDVFVCMCRPEQVEDILESYAELWCLVVDRNIHLLDKYPIEKLTNDKVLQGWESFEETKLENIETGEKFWYISTRDENGVDRYELKKI